ncbi:amino acid adenylation domain-containing protein [Photorhabdus tasmaniensis]
MKQLQKVISLTPYQQDIFFENQRNPQSAQYTLAQIRYLSGDINLDKLVMAANNVLNQEIIGKIQILEENELLTQRINHCMAEVKVEIINSEYLQSQSQTGEDFIAAWPAKVFSLTGVPLLEVAIVTPNQANYVALLLRTHHIVCDGWGMNLLSTKILQQYQSSEPAPEYAFNTQKEYLAAITQSLEHLKHPSTVNEVSALAKTIEGVEPVLFTRQKSTGNTQFIKQQMTLTRYQVESALTTGMSPLLVMTTALAVLLTRIHNNSHITIGIPLFNRQESNINTIGEWANTLPISVTVDSAMSLRVLTQQIKQKIKFLKQYEHVPLSQLIKTHNRAGNISRLLFDVTVSYLQLQKIPAFEKIEHHTNSYANGHETDVLAIHMITNGDNNDVAINFRGAADVFNTDYSFEQFTASLSQIILQIITAPDSGISHIDIFPTEKEQQLQSFEQGPNIAFSDRETISTLFEKQAALYPEAIAIKSAKHASQSWNYQQLQAHTDNIASMLVGHGVQSGDVVAVMIERSEEMLAAIFATLKVGATYLPIDISYPAERIEYILQDSGVSVILTERSINGTFAEHYQVLNSRDASDTVTLPLLNRSDPNSLAYIIYTSGSTGWPKGVMIEHRSVVNRLEWMQEKYPLNETDVILQKTPISFDVSIWELFWWSITGASVALLPPGAQKDPLEIIKAIKEHDVTTVHFVPSMLFPFLNALEMQPELITQISSLRRIFTSGEALSPARVNQFKRIFTQFGKNMPLLVNLYGPTEATVDVSYYEIPTSSTDEITRVPIGYPINNTALRIMSLHNTRQPIGVAGELQIGGVGLARGYLNKPELTDEKFIRDISGLTTERWYRTGDLTRWLPDGSIEYLGRIDNQVKIRGNRIELGEIQNTLERMSGITRAEVLPEHNEQCGTYLCAYYVASKNYTADTLRDRLLDSLPEFMVPAKFIAVPFIPLTPNGKADRNALSQLTQDKVLATAHRPSTELEKTLVKIWQSVLNISNIGIKDSFYSIGGDSILMLKIRSEAEKAGIKVTLSQLTQYLTISALSQQVELSQPITDTLDLLPFALIDEAEKARLSGFADAYPATQLQLGLIYHSQQANDSAKYKDVFRYTLQAKWEPNHFRKSAVVLIQRHPALRSHFNLADFKEPLQIVNESIDIDSAVTITDLSEIDIIRAEYQIIQYMHQQTHHHYLFDQAPLFNIRLFKTAEALELILSFHHAILDGNSVANLIRELLHHYIDNDGKGITDIRLPSPALSVQNELLSLTSVEDKIYWQNELSGLSRTQVTGYRLYDVPSDEVLISKSVSIPDDIEERLKDWVQQQRVSTKSVFFAAHCATIALFAEQDEIVTGLITHSRPGVQNSEYLLGLFLNTLPVRFSATGKTWIECVNDVFITEQRHSPHRKYPLNAIQQAAGDGAKISTAFNYVYFHALAAVFNSPDLRLISFIPWEETNFEILVNVMTDFATGRNVLRCDFDGTVFSSVQADMFIDAYLTILRNIVSRSDEKASLSTIPKISTHAITPSSTFTSVIDEINWAVSQHKSAIALKYGNEKWRFDELWHKSALIADALVKRGVRAETPIGIALKRSPELIATLIGVLRAGGICFPLDLSYPAQRIEAMIGQVKPLLIITNRAPQPASPQPPATPLIDVNELLQGPDSLIQPTAATIAPEQIAYLLFTSGSTGIPKGVAMPHRSLANLVKWQNSTASGIRASSTLQYAPLSFDVSFQEIFSTLASGGTLHLISDEQRKDPANLLRLLHQHQIERIYLPYVALQQLAETADTLNIYPEKLKVVISSGEQLRVTDEIRKFIGKLEDGLLENQYGPTETHVITSFTMSGNTETFPALPPIGTAINNANVLILDDKLQEVFPGVRGEIYVSGPLLALGYYNQPELSAERFITLTNSPGKWYRTGDLGIKLNNGVILCLGRKDSQVKVRGYRVELAEVELAIASTPGTDQFIKDIAVVIQQHNTNDRFLVAFLVGEKSDNIVDKVSEHLLATLPQYMIPSHIEWLDSLPKTPSGKRDDRQLSQTVITRHHTDSHDGKPNDSYERTLCELAADLLKIPSISVHQNLFDMGGTSLTAMRLVVLVEKHFGVNIPLSVFVSDPTIAQLALRVRHSDAQAHFSPLVPMRTTGKRRPLFFVHPMGGNVLSYLRLVKHLPADQPFYALQAHGVDAGSTPLATVQQQAANYIQTIRQIQPQGPYSLGGWSYGGFVAFEMARQLKESGEKIADLFVLDTMTLNAQSRWKTDDDALLNWFFWELLWLNQGASLPEQIVPKHITTLQERFEYITEHAIVTGAIPQASSRAVVQRLFEVYKTNWQAAADYSTHNIANVDMTLLHATRPLPNILRSMHDAVCSEYRDPKNGWGNKTTGKLNVIDVPGDHLEIMEEPYVAEVAKVILNEMRISSSLTTTSIKSIK